MKECKTDENNIVIDLINFKDVDLLINDSNIYNGINITTLGTTISSNPSGTYWNYPTYNWPITSSYGSITQGSSFTGYSTQPQDDLIYFFNYFSDTFIPKTIEEAIISLYKIFDLCNILNDLKYSNKDIIPYYFRNVVPVMEEKWFKNNNSLVKEIDNFVSDTKLRANFLFKFVFLMRMNPGKTVQMLINEEIVKDIIE